MELSQDYSDRALYVIVLDTYRILYADEACASMFGRAPYPDETCYAYRYGFDEPCSWCPVAGIEAGCSGLGEFHQEEDDRWFQYDYRRMEWSGHDACMVYIVETTEQRRAIDELKGSRRALQSATDTANLVLWEYDIKTHRVVMSVASGYTRWFCGKLGISAILDVAAEDFLQLIDPEDREGFLKMYQDIDAGASEAECEVGFYFKDSPEHRFEHIICTAVSEDDGSLKAVYGLGQDVTRKKQEQQRYIQAFEQLSRIYPDALGSFHLNLTKNWCGNGESPLDFVLKQQESGTADGYFLEFSKLIDDEEIRERFFETFNRKSLLDAFEHGTTKVSIEYPILYDDGIRHWRSGLLFMVQNPVTGDIEAVTYAVDIDDRKREEQVFKLITEEEFDFIGLLRPSNGQFLFLNKHEDVNFCQLGAWQAYDSGRRSCRDEFVPEHERSRYWEISSLASILAHMERDGEYSYSFQYFRDGTDLRKHVQCRWFDKPGGDILLARSDITAAYEEEQRQIAEMQEALLSADRANEAKSSFLSNMSHDIRTPLNGIIGFTELALHEDDVNQIHAYLGKVRSSGELLQNLVNDTLELSRIESGKMVWEPAVYPTREIGMAVVEALRPDAEAKGIKLVAGECPDGFVYMDKLKEQKIWLNLLSNAIKFTPAGGIIYAGVEKIEPPVNGRNRRIVVEDSGIGMSEEYQKEMFEPFSQEIRLETENMQGTGLGLTIVKRIVELAGGTISVKSEMNEGTRFEIELPVPRVDAAYRAEDGQHRDISLLAGIRVLLTEDNDLNAEIATILLREHGVEIERAHDGQEACESFSGSAPGYFDAILMDVRMPRMDGREAARAIRALDRIDARTIPIIAMSADAFEEDIRANLDAGMNAHVTKPIRPDQLFEVLTDAIIQERN